MAKKSLEERIESTKNYLKEELNILRDADTSQVTR